MYPKLIGSLLVSIGLSCLSNTQEAVIPCGTTGHLAEVVAARILLNKENLLEKKEVQFRNTRYVPITFHLVARSEGSDRASEGWVLDQLCALNEDFAPIDIQFYHKDGQFSYADNDFLYYRACFWHK